MTMLMRKNWRLNTAVPAAGSLPERILASRGLRTSSDVADFLQPALKDLHDPFLLPDINTACAMITQAIDQKQLITIHGDYDADGITATALLARFFRRIGVGCCCMIPDRMIDGYGLTMNAATEIIKSGCCLLITVDCGITSFNEVNMLQAAGISVIVTDHHECQSELPAAPAVINPKRPDSQYPFRGLAGVGVVLKLIQALCQTRNLGDLWLADLELAALGTVADVVPLLDENRIIVAHGLDLIPRKRQIGLAAIIETVGLSNKPITARTLGFIIAPRINAAGRLGKATIALDLLLTEDKADALAMAATLTELNRLRQELETAITAEAIQEIEGSFDFTSSDVVIVAHDGWNQGVIGIVASRIAEQYCRPVIVLSGEDGIYRGSCRTWGDFNILEAIEQAAAYTIKFGGHRKAAGLTLSSSQLADFCRTINQYAAKTMKTDQLQPVLIADLEITEADLTMDNAAALQNLAPFGEDNPQPLLIIRKLKLGSVRMAGNGRHLKLQLKSATTPRTFEGIAFGLGDADDLFAEGDQVDILFALEINSWLGKETLSLNIRDMMHGQVNDEFTDFPWIADQAYQQKTNLKVLMQQYHLPIQALKPVNTEYKAVYQYIRAKFGGQPVLADLSLLARRISRSYQSELNMFKLSRILSVFQEASLIDMQQLGSDRIRLLLLPVAGQVCLGDTPAYQRLAAEEGDL